MICQYLEERYPEPPNLQGDAPPPRSGALAGKYADYEIAPLATLTIFRNRILKPAMGQACEENDVRRALEEKLPAHFDYLENHLDGRAFFVGERLTLADLAIASQLVNLRHAGENLDEQRWPALAAHFARMLERPAMQALLPGNDGPSTSSQRKPERVAQQSVRRRNISTRPSIPAWSSALKRATLGLSRSSTATRRPSEQGHHQFAAGSAVAGDVAGKRVDVVDPLGQPGTRRGAADALGEGNADAGDLALERSQDQFLVAVQIEAGPVQVAQLMEEKGGELRGVGDEIALAGEQRLGLRRQQGVAGQPGARLLQIDHAWRSSSCLPTQ